MPDASITYNFGLGTKRNLWMPIFFCKKHDRFAKLILAAVTKPSSRWAFIGQATFMDSIGKRRAWESIALVTEEEKLSDELHYLPNAMDSSGFLHWSDRVLCSKLGSCGA